MEKYGFKTITCKVKSLRKKLGMRSKQVKKFKATTNSNHDMPVAPNLLEQKFTATAPNQVWLTNIAYVQTDERWLYLTGYVAEKRPPLGLIHRSDRDSRYCAHEYCKLLDQPGMMDSMPRRGNLLRQRADGKLTGVLKNELVHHRKLATRAKSIEEIAEYIDFLPAATYAGAVGLSISSRFCTPML